MAVVEQLLADELLGESAFRHGAPDRVMLVSGGPVSHLASWSLVAAPSTKRVVVRQPGRDVLPAAPSHEPLSGDVQLVDAHPLLEAEVEVEAEAVLKTIQPPVFAATYDSIFLFRIHTRISLINSKCVLLKQLYTLT